MVNKETANNKKTTKEKKKPFRHIKLDLTRVTFGTILILTSWPVYHYQEGAPKRRRFKGRAVITSNHISFNDGIIINMAWIRRRIHILTKSEVYDVPFLRWFLTITESIVIDTNHLDLEGMRNALNVLKDDSILVVFPQGQIRGDDIGDMKGGAAFFAMRGNAPIIPMYLTDRLRPLHRNHIYVGKPIDTSAIVAEAIEKGEKKLDYLTEKIKEAILDLRYIYHADFLKKHKKKERWEFSKPEAGDQIRVDCGGYHHHGIYIDDSTIVQFGTRELSTAEDVCVNVTDIHGFCGDGFIEVRRHSFYQSKIVNDASVVCKIALSKVGNKGYHILHNNCEHFSYFCAFGPDLVRETQAILGNDRVSGV